VTEFMTSIIVALVVFVRYKSSNANDVSAPSWIITFY